MVEHGPSIQLVSRKGQLGAGTLSGRLCPLQPDQADSPVYQQLELAQHIPANNGSPWMAQSLQRQAAKRRRNRNFQQRNFQNSIKLRELADTCRSGSFVSAERGQLQFKGKADVYRRCVCPGIQ